MSAGRCVVVEKGAQVALRPARRLERFDAAFDQVDEERAQLSRPIQAGRQAHQRSAVHPERRLHVCVRLFRKPALPHAASNPIHFNRLVLSRTGCKSIKLDEVQSRTLSWRQTRCLCSFSRSSRTRTSRRFSKNTRSTSRSVSSSASVSAPPPWPWPWPWPWP